MPDCTVQYSSRVVEELPAQPDRSARKRASIVDAARAVFVADGFADATMDRVAAAAGVSKVTVYKQFTDKQTLFTAVFTSAIAEAESTDRALVDGLGDSDDLERDLRVFARSHIAVVTSPELVAMRRMIIAEAGRFPELARTWHAAGPERGHARLAEQIRRLHRRKVLHAPDPVLAAQHLNYLILSVPLNEAMFTGRTTPYPRRQLHRWADEAVRVFLAGYA